MAPLVKLGPAPLASKTSLTPMMKEISQRKSHIDLVFSCDDGSVSGHKFVVGAQSKFLKALLKSEDNGEKAELRLPGIKILHLKRAVKFMYTGQLKMTKQEIEKEHMVWHVNHILIDLFRVDAKLNLPAHLLKPPPKKPEPDPPPSNGRGESGHSGSSAQIQAGSGSSSPKVSDVEHTRQNTVIHEKVPENQEKKKEELQIDCRDKTKTERKKHQSGDSDIQEVEQERVATPDIIDLLDSDPEEDNARGNLNEESVSPESVFVNVDTSISEKTSDNDNVPIPEAPKLIQRSSSEKNSSEEVHRPARAVARKHTSSFSTKSKVLKHAENNLWEDNCVSEQEQVESDTDQESVKKTDQQENAKKKRPVARKHTGPRGNAKKRKPSDIFSLAVKEAEIDLSAINLPLARKSVIEQVLDHSPMNSIMPPIDILATFQGLQPLPPAMLNQFEGQRFPPPNIYRPSFMSPQLGPTQTIYRGKITNYRKVTGSKSTKTIRKHNHIPWTMTGLKKAETFAVVKEEKAIHTCDICGVKYEKYRSLQIHKNRSHNENLKVECPEGCGKLLSNTNAIKKHLLSHRPEEEWPHECPLCHKKFQARGDIPKHLKTKMHENDNIPVMGTKAWFDLVYHDDRNFDYGAMKVKLEKQEARERNKLPPGMYPPSVINLENHEELVGEENNSGFNSSSTEVSNFTMASASQGDLPSIPCLEGLDDFQSLLDTSIPPPLSVLSTGNTVNVLSGSDSLAVFAEDGLFSSLGTEASVLL